jgi:hypothetical protein
MISVEDDVNCGGSLVFEYVEDARVASIVPTQGSMEGGTSVSVVGTGFRGKVSCRVGMRECRGAQRVSSTLLTCVTAGQREAGDVMVEVSNNGAEYFGGDVRFRYTEQWKIVSAYPSRGPDAGNTVVTVIGEGFPSESSFSCRFGKAAASTGQRMSASVVRCASPSRGASGNVSVSLSDNWGDYKHGSALFRYEATLQAKSVMPSSGFVDGGTEVTVLGLGFDAGMQLLCRFGQRDEEARMVSSTSVACMAPAQPAGVLRLGLLDDKSGASSGQDLLFEYLDSFEVHEVFPSSGSVLGGTPVRMRGRGFTQAMRCRFGVDSPLSFCQVNSSSLMYCTTSSAESPGKVLIRWHLTDRYYKDSVNAFEFVVPAEVFSVFPSVTVGSRSTIVTVSGTGFAATDQLGCKVEPTWSAAMFVSSSRIICTAEKHAPGRVDLQVTVNGVDYSTEGLVFEYLPDIGVRAVTPSTGSHVGGYSITVQGSGFDSRLYLVCMFGSLRSKAVFVDSHAVICEVPKVESDQGVRVRVVVDAHTAAARIPRIH